MNEKPQNKRLARRKFAEWRFRAYGILALALAGLALAALLANVVTKGASGFLQTEIRLSVLLDPAVIDPAGTRDSETLRKAFYGRLLHEALRGYFPAVSEKAELRALYGMLSLSAAERLRDAVLSKPSLIGRRIEIWLPTSSSLDMRYKGKVVREDALQGRMRALEETKKIRFAFNRDFLFGGDSREPERAGFGGSIMGSVLTLLVCMALAFPLGVMTAVYLEEFAPKNRLTDSVEVNINNLAAVPSIVFGLLGLSVYLGFFGLPRSAPLVGGLTLGLMILPVIIITTRAALKSVPPSVRAGALALGASPLQVVLHHVLPLGLPGIMTGAILGMARAIGETAPLLMIGMVAFIADVPGSVTEPATAMPVQVYLWASSPEAGFVEKTSAGILVLLALLMVMNSAAIFIRRKFEIRW